MWILERGNYLFFAMMILIIIIIMTVVYVLRNKSKTVSHSVVLILLISAFLLHFIKLLFIPYVNHYPNSITKSTFENICAANTILFPIFYLSKKKIFRDYMIIIGTFSLISLFLLPNGITSHKIYEFDVIRYYYAHLVLFLAPLLMLTSKIHQLNIKRIFLVPFVFLFVLLLILYNDLMLVAVGLIETDFDSLFNPEIRNISLIYGPPSDLAKMEWFINLFVPDVFQTIPFGRNRGSIRYWPIIWLVIPSYLLISLLGMVIYFVNKLFIPRQMT